MNTNSALVIPAQSSATNAAAELTLHDIKPPVEVPNPWLWFWWALGIVIFAVTAFLLWRWWKRNQPVKAERLIPSHERARQKLEAALGFISEPERFTVAVSDTIRIYLEERFNFRAPERTTEEFLYELQNTQHLTPDQKQSLGEFLSRCDLVKFARYEPTENELRELHSAANRLVDETEPEIIEPLSQQHPANLENVQFPASVQTASDNRRISKGKAYAIAGTCMQITPLVWVISYLIALIRLLKLAMHFKTNPSLALQDVLKPFNQISSIYMDSLFLAIVGLMVGVVGLILLVIALVKFRYRAEWFFWFLIIYGAMLLATPFGIFFVVYCLLHRREFISLQPLKVEVRFK